MDADVRVGSKIKSYRIAKNITIKDLAAEAQITPSMLSQIERDRVNPSLNTIRLLAIALDIPLFRFFMNESDTWEEVIHPEQRKRIIQEGVEYELLTPDMNGGIEFYQLVLSPSTSTATKPLAHNGAEAALVLKGSFELTLDGRSYFLREGDSVRIKPHASHCWLNRGPEEAVLVFAVASPGF